jgi:hypothetical protein
MHVLASSLQSLLPHHPQLLHLPPNSLAQNFKLLSRLFRNLHFLAPPPISTQPHLAIRLFTHSPQPRSVQRVHYQTRLLNSPIWPCLLQFLGFRGQRGERVIARRWRLRRGRRTRGARVSRASVQRIVRITWRTRGPAVDQRYLLRKHQGGRGTFSGVGCCDFVLGDRLWWMSS